MDELFELIREWSTRSKLQWGLHWLFFGLAGGLGVALTIAVLARLFPILSTTALIVISITCALAGAFGAFLLPWIRASRTSPETWARQFDQQFHLKERLSTALELRDGTVNTNNDPLRRLQQDDAAATAHNLDVKKLLPLRLSRRYAFYAAAIMLALATTIALPNPQQEVLANRAQMQQVVDEQLKQLELAKEQAQQSSALTDNQKKQVVQALDDAQKALSDPNTTPEKALAAINDAQSKLDALKDQSTQDQANDLQQAGQSLAPDQLTNPLANSLENGNMKQASDQMRNLPQNNGQPLTDDQRQRLANQLEQIARNVQNSNNNAADQLRQAAQQLRDKQDQAAQQSLNQVADNLNQLSQKQSAEQQLSKAQASMDDTRRAVNEANQQNQAQADTQQGQSSQQASQSQSSSAQQTQQGNQQGNQASADDSQQGTTDQQAGGTSMAQGGAAQNGSNNNAQSQHHEDVGTDSSVMAPQRINAAGQNVVLPEAKGQNVPNPNAQSNPGVSNQATVPYQQVYPQYAKTADDAIQNGQVPADLRDYVRDYFSSLDPRKTK